MKCEQVHELLPEYSEAALSRAMMHETVRTAVKDLGDTLKHLARHPERSPARSDWGTTRADLLSEIGRLTESLTNEG